MITTSWLIIAPSISKRSFSLPSSDDSPSDVGSTHNVQALRLQSLQKGHIFYGYYIATEGALASIKINGRNALAL